MLVYGIRCAPNDLIGLASEVNADYYLDYGLLVFPAYTRPTCLNARGNLNEEFWGDLRRLLHFPLKPRLVDIEQPFITDEESSLLNELQEYYPGLQTEWYYVPCVSQSQSQQLH
jgi:hypothetical protein